MSPLRRAALLALCLMAGGAAVAAAQPAPYHHYNTLGTPHFRVHAPDGLEREGRVAGAAAERAYALLARELVAPRGIIDLVVSDDADYSNGYATPFPTNRIVVFATPPVESEALRLNEDWLGIVITHELTHIFHLDRAEGPWRIGQRIFGRAPFLFPNIYGPSWLTEGLAVWYESRLTEGGRLKGAEHRMLALAAAIDHDLPRLRDLSLGTPRFPGGSGVYSYGSLLVQYVARTYGDSAVRRFVDVQSRQWNPLAIDRAARVAFGADFTDAFEQWRDSVQRAAAPRAPPFTGWGDAGPRTYAASAPRWLNDTTLLYTGTDGRETVAAYAITLGGARTRLGRRDAVSATSVFPDGALLYAQPQFTGPEEYRSDLYVTRAGRTTQLTHGARLVQPDVSGDGRIVAVELAAARSSIVLLNSEGGDRRVLRAAGPDETWSEPRWAPGGQRIAAVHRTHGGVQSIDVIDAESGVGCPFVLDSTLLASPSWSSERELVYSSERSGLPQIEMAYRCNSERARVSNAPAGVTSPEAFWRTRRIAAIEVRADGYHLGAGWPSVGYSPSHNARSPLTAVQNVAADSQALSPGQFRSYSPWRTLLPSYWLPVIEPAAGSGTRLGISTSGSDVVGRHAYSLFGAVPTSSEGVVGGLSYRYAGLRRPLIDLSLSQDWTSLGELVDGSGQRIGQLLKRTQDASLSAAFVHPGTRRRFTITAGTGMERRAFATDVAALLASDPVLRGTWLYPRLFLAAGWGNTQRPRFSISPEDGVSLAMTARERWRTDAASRTASASVVATAAGYKSLDLPGFAHHVLAARVAGGVADSRAASAFEVGGTSGTAVDVIGGYTVGEGRRTFGVRGFPTASTYGTSAVAASVEYRAPLLFGGRGLPRVPVFFDRSSLSLFGDAGRASCHASPLYPQECAPAPVLGRTIASVGAELSGSIAVLSPDGPEIVRFGVAVPVAGTAGTRARSASVYLAFGFAY